VDIEFATGKLARTASSYSEVLRIYGEVIGRKYHQRLMILRAADTVIELYGHRALKLHPLKGNRAGQMAMTLTGNYRLVFERAGRDRVRILSVEDYHGG
jgi:proteic killer suppression protein